MGKICGGMPCSRAFHGGPVPGARPAPQCAMKTGARYCPGCGSSRRRRSSDECGFAYRRPSAGGRNPSMPPWRARPVRGPASAARLGLRADPMPPQRAGEVGSRRGAGRPTFHLEHGHVSAFARRGMAKATVRAVSGLLFQAITTRRPRVTGALGGTTRTGLPLSNRAASWFARCSGARRQ